MPRREGVISFLNIRPKIPGHEYSACCHKQVDEPNPRVQRAFMGVRHYEQREQSTFLTTAAQIISRKPQQSKKTPHLSPSLTLQPRENGFIWRKNKTLAQRSKGGALPNVKWPRSHFQYMQPSFPISGTFLWRRVNSALIPRHHKPPGSDVQLSFHPARRWLKAQPSVLLGMLRQCKNWCVVP